MQELDLFVLDAVSGATIPAFVKETTEADLAAAGDWQTSWCTPFAMRLPHKVALRCIGNNELLDLMSYELDDKSLAMEIVCIESALHSNADLLHTTCPCGADFFRGGG